MDGRLQQRVQRYGWDKAAGYYEQYWQQQLLPAQDRLVEMLSVQPGEKVLDIACGTGLISFRVAVIAAHVTGTDISDRMIEHCRQLAAERKTGNMQFERMEAEKLSFGSELFDVTISSLGLMYVTDGQQSVNEMYRVLKPGGRAAALVWGQRNRCGWAEIFPVVDARVATEVCPLFFRLGTGDILKTVFEQAGFSNVILERMQTILHYDTEEAAIGAAFIGGPVALAYNRFTETVKREAHAEYLASVAEYKNEQGYAIPGEFVLVTGYKK